MGAAIYSDAMAAPSTQTLAATASRCLQVGDRVGFVRAVTALADLRAPMTQGWKSLTTPLLDYGEFPLACRVMDLFVAAMGNAPAARFEQALVYVRSARPTQAMAILDGIARDVPDRAGNAYLRGTIALNLGDRDAAREALLAASAARPQSGQILQSLSMLGSMADEPIVAERILGAERLMGSARSGDRAAYGYALGKTLDDLEQTDRAFAAFAEAAALVALERPYDAALDRQVAVNALGGWTGDALAAIATQVTLPTARPIIVTGLPRSGSTLVEQILVSHSQVTDGDELARFALVVGKIGGTGHADLTAWLARHAAIDATRFYLHLLNQRFGKGGRVVDKTLEASRYLGTLAALMPDAPILWMRRDPLDNAWSCFSTYFLAGLSWSWEQRALAQHMRLEDELLARWQDILGDRLMIVDYEALVRGKEEGIPRLLAHCGLAVEPQVFTPEKTERLVTTASMSQVRAPINTGAVGKGHRYAGHLAPFVEAYGYDG